MRKNKQPPIGGYDLRSRSLGIDGLVRAEKGSCGGEECWDAIPSHHSPPRGSIVRDASKSAMRSAALVRFDRGSQEASWSGYPTHLTRYSRALQWRRESRMRSTSYSSWSSMVTASGGRGPVGI